MEIGLARMMIAGRPDAPKRKEHQAGEYGARDVRVRPRNN